MVSKEITEDTLVKTDKIKMQLAVQVTGFGEAYINISIVCY